MIKLTNLSLGYKQFNNQNITALIAKTLNTKTSNVKNFVLLKQSIDSRRKPNIKYVFSVAAELVNYFGFEQQNNFEPDFSTFNYNQVSSKLKPIVVGFGPAGMFCALALSLMGLKPIVIEQGSKIETRDQDVLNYINTNKLNPHSNIQFGEGGAGTYSDGKLNTNLNSPYIVKILNELIALGAPKEIYYFSKPHIGSDKLKTVVVNLRNKILSLGGTILFNTKMIDFDIKNNNISSVIVKNTIDGAEQVLNTNHLVLAIGHSARDTFELIYNKELNLKQKPFAMGVRIEQLQSDINFSQYGTSDLALPAAEYKLVAHLKNGRSVFTFCMCPGGEVVNSASEPNQIVTNGMSNFARNKTNANSAVLVNVTPQDFESDHPLAGMYFQRKYEQLAYSLTNSNACPAQSVSEFLFNKKIDSIEPSLKIKHVNIADCLPDFITQSLKLGLPELNKKLNNFAAPKNLLIAIESRSSSPITIVRNEEYVSNVCGIYPAGEGAGYAGGIMTSAVDGIKVAEAIYNSILKN